MATAPDHSTAVAEAEAPQVPQERGHHDVTVDREFRQLVPPLTDSERRQLEESLLSEGCRDPICVWGNLVIDGHNRHEICTEHCIAYKVVQVDLPDRDSAKAWIIHNQLGRRNLTPYQRGELALAMKGLFAAEAKKNLVASGKRHGKGLQNSANPIKPKHTRAQLAKFAGVSTDTMGRIERIVSEADGIAKTDLRAGETSINAVYKKLCQSKERGAGRRKAPKEVERATGRKSVNDPDSVAAQPAPTPAAPQEPTGPPRDADEPSHIRESRETPKRILKLLQAHGSFTHIGLRQGLGSKDSVFLDLTHRPDGGSLLRARAAAREDGASVVALLPAATDTPWWHDHVMTADQVQFIRGRLPLSDTGSEMLPLPSVVVTWNGRSAGKPPNFPSFSWDKGGHGGQA